MRLGVLLAALLAVLAASRRAGAAPDRAEILIREGVELRKKGQNAEALSRFQAAYEMAHTARAAAQLGLCLAALEKWVDADAYLTESLVSSDPWIDRNRAVLDSTAANVRAHLVTVKIAGRPNGAAVRVNGEPVGRLPTIAPVRVLPGEITATATLQGHEEHRLTKPGNPGETITFEFTLRPVPATPPATSIAAPAPSPQPANAQPFVRDTADNVTKGGWLRPAAYVSGGLAVAALGLAVFSHVQRETAASDFRNGSCNKLADGAITGGTGCEDAAERFDSARTRMIVGYVAGGVLGASALAFALADAARAKETASTAACAPTFALLGASCRFRF